MDNTPFHRPLRLELAYESAIQRLLERLFKLPSLDTLADLYRYIADYQQAYSVIQGFATQLATGMITQVAFKNAQSWREAARQASKGRIIYEMLRQEMCGPLRDRLHFLIHQNAQLISSVPANIAVRASRYIQQEQMKGRRSEDIVRDIEPYMQHLKQFQVERIARTEVAKADTAITRARAESINLNWYQWATSEDARVRDSHRFMDGVLISWDDPPSPEALIHLRSVGHYHAGNIFNCRCVALPIVTLKEIHFPARVYRLGRIERMTKNQFMAISGIPLHLAA